MLRFLFWNLGRKASHTLITQIVEAHDVDVLVLAETGTLTPPVIAAELNAPPMQRPYHHARPNVDAGNRVHIFIRFARELVGPVWDTNRMTVRHLKLPGRGDFLLAGVHLASKLHTRDDEQSARCVELARDIRDQERKVGHQRTIVVGDLNMKPFETGVAGAPGLNAVMSRTIAARGQRTVESREHSFLYDPMWNHFGEQGRIPPDTYYYESSTHLWNMFDQVLIRPDFMDRFVEDSFTVATNVGSESLISRGGLPRREAVSDHLPLLSPAPPHVVRQYRSGVRAQSRRGGGVVFESSAQRAGVERG